MEQNYFQSILGKIRKCINHFLIFSLIIALKLSLAIAGYFTLTWNVSDTTPACNSKNDNIQWWGPASLHQWRINQVIVNYYQWPLCAAPSRERMQLIQYRRVDFEELDITKTPVTLSTKKPTVDFPQAVITKCWKELQNIANRPINTSFIHPWQ